MGDINWTISLGSDLTDVLEISNQGAAVAPTNSIDVTLGASGIDLNSDANLDVTVSGVDTTEVFGGAANDTIWGEGDTTTGAPYPGKLIVDGGDDTAVGCAGYSGDTISGGAGDDVLSGGADTSGCNEDYVDYSAATGPANVSLTTGLGVAPGLGIDTLCAVAAGSCATVGPDGAVMGADAVGNTFEDIGGSANNDTLTGDAGAFGNDILPGAGDDTVDCVAGGYDLIDYSDSSTGVTVDMSTGKVTGDGNDTFTHCDNAVGSDENDTFVDDTTTGNDYYGLGGNDMFDQGADPAVGDTDGISGGPGTDLVDYSQRTDDLAVDLNNVQNFGCSGDLGVGECDTYAGIENVKLGAGDDAFWGTAFNNVVWPEGGANTLNGGVGGIDTLNYSEGYTAGVTVNMTGGGPTGGNADSAVNFENAIGTDFNDMMLGTDVVVGTNGANYLYGGKGNDILMGNAGPDVLVGGPGNDSERGGSGDDTLKGNAGNDHLRGGSGDDDIFGGPGKDTCSGGPGDDFIKNCMKKHHHHQIQLQAPVAKIGVKLV